MKHLIVTLVCIAIVALVGIYVYYNKMNSLDVVSQDEINAMRMEKVHQSSKVLTKEEALRLMAKVSNKGQ
ncbi:MAG: hypothetical protein KBD47_01375 [Candidatus Pacebacteria bacterium]|jgi:hypothetical protein|nr:hypothetical protein [Candidatus Paceibacterota bacterium]